MISKFQHRLLGTVILFALAIIFLPWLLDGKKEYDITLLHGSPLTSPADIHHSFLSLNSPDPLESHKTESRKALSPEEKKISKETPIPEDPVRFNVPDRSLPLEEKPQPEKALPEIRQGYVIQLGAFNNVAAVNQIIAKLRLSGYQVFTLPSVPVKGKMTRILVGPDPSKARLESMLPELYRLVGLNGQIKNYQSKI